MQHSVLGGIRLNGSQAPLQKAQTRSWRTLACFGTVAVFLVDWFLSPQTTIPGRSVNIYFWLGVVIECRRFRVSSNICQWLHLRAQIRNIWTGTAAWRIYYIVPFARITIISPRRTTICFWMRKPVADRILHQPLIVSFNVEASLKISTMTFCKIVQLSLGIGFRL